MRSLRRNKNELSIKIYRCLFCRRKLIKTILFPFDKMFVGFLSTLRSPLKEKFGIPTKNSKTNSKTADSCQLHDRFVQQANPFLSTERIAYRALSKVREEIANLRRKAAHSIYDRGLSSSCSRILQTLYELGNERCNTTLQLITFSWEMRYPLYADQTIFDLSRPFLITFTTKSYLRGETHMACKLYTL